MVFVESRRPAKVSHHSRVRQSDKCTLMRCIDEISSRPGEYDDPVSEDELAVCGADIWRLHQSFAGCGRRWMSVDVARARRADAGGWWKWKLEEVDSVEP